MRHWGGGEAACVCLGIFEQSISKSVIPINLISFWCKEEIIRVWKQIGHDVRIGFFGDKFWLNKKKLQVTITGKQCKTEM